MYVHINSTDHTVAPSCLLSFPHHVFSDEPISYTGYAGTGSCCLRGRALDDSASLDNSIHWVNIQRYRLTSDIGDVVHSSPKLATVISSVMYLVISLSRQDMPVQVDVYVHSGSVNWALEESPSLINSVHLINIERYKYWQGQFQFLA